MDTYCPLIVVTDPGAVLFNKRLVSICCYQMKLKGFLGAWGVKVSCVAGDWEGDWQVL